jgi:Uncharacterized phage-encoded protein
MNEMIKVVYDNDRPTVSGRALHEFLDVGTLYKDWFPRMCEYGFAEGTDFNPLKFEQVRLEGEREVKRSVTDHQLTVAMAKELSMLQRNEKGRQARQYFIELEEAWNTPEQVMARALKFADRQIEEVKSRVFLLEQTVEEQKPKVLFADSVSASKDSILIRELAKLLQQNGVKTGEKRLFAFLRDNGYLIKKRGADYNTPTQYSAEHGWFEIVKTLITHSDGTVSVRRTPKVTGKGQQYFINLFLGDNKKSA